MSVPTMLSEEAYGELLLDCMPPCDPAAPSREICVVINSDLIRIVEECGVDISSLCERGLTEQVRLLMLNEWRRSRKNDKTTHQSDDWPSTGNDADK